MVENYQAIKAVVDGGGGNSTTNATSVGVCNLFCANDTPLNNETLGIVDFDRFNYSSVVFVVVIFGLSNRVIGHLETASL